MIDCGACRVAFEPNANGQKYCGPECRLSVRRARNKQWRDSNPDALRELKRASYERNRETIRAKDKAYYAANREKVLGQAKAWRAANPDARRRYAERERQKSRERKYGLTAERYDEMIEAQGGLCLICEKPPATVKGLVVDHCHESGRVRGLLCQTCNSGIGMFGDQPDVVRRALSYLEAA